MTPPHDKTPKIYTKTGDKGTTGLIDGSRVSKANIRIEALGTLDEANAHIGILMTLVAPDHVSRTLLLKTQSLLFTCGSRMAEPGEESALGLNLPGQTIIKEYEASIDAMTNQLPPLTQFILPGGTPLAAQTHVTRAVIRRAERLLIALKDSGAEVEPGIIQYINRLSDWFFTLARFYNWEVKEPEIIWRSS